LEVEAVARYRRRFWETVPTAIQRRQKVAQVLDEARDTYLKRANIKSLDPSDNPDQLIFNFNGKDVCQKFYANLLGMATPEGYKSKQQPLVPSLSHPYCSVRRVCVSLSTTAHPIIRPKNNVRFSSKTSEILQEAAQYSYTPEWWQRYVSCFCLPPCMLSSPALLTILVILANLCIRIF
jgi:hypothetical protein